MSRRTLGIVAVVVVVVGVFAAGLAISGPGSPGLHAIPISPSLPAPTTVGRDASGQLVSVPEAGRPALVTFFYTHCLTTCPVMAGEIAAALDAAGPATTAKIDVVAVSVDPAGDTPQNVHRFLGVHDLLGRMEYIIGTRAQLSPIWAAWNISVKPGAEVYVPAMRMYMPQVNHSAVLYLINKHGQEVGTYSGSTTIPVANLAADITTLVNQ